MEKTRKCIYCKKSKGESSFAWFDKGKTHRKTYCRKCSPNTYYRLLYRMSSARQRTELENKAVNAFVRNKSRRKRRIK